MATQYDPIAKDGSLNTTELTPRNIADVLADGLGDIVSALGGGSLEDLNDVTITTPSNGQTLVYNSTTQKWENANGGGSGGHTIISPDGTSMTQRAGLDFVDAHISDDSVNDETVVEIVEGISKTDWDNLDPTDPSKNGLYEIEMPNDTPILDDTQVAHGNSTVNAAINAFGDLVELATGGGFTTLETITLLQPYTDFKFVCIAVQWNNNGKYSNAVVLPSFILGTTEETTIHLNNIPSNAYLELRYMNDISDTTHIKVQPSNANVYYAIYGIK